MANQTNSQLKKEQRAAYSEIRDRIGTARRDAAAQSLSTIEIPESMLILSFVSMRSEIGTQLLNARLYEEGRLLLPKWSPSGLITYRVTDLSKLLYNRFGFLEPVEETPELPDLVITPGLAFDHQNNRLGYGGGAYDRFFCTHPHLVRWGVAFTEQRSMMLAHEPHDIPMHQCFFY